MYVYSIIKKITRHKTRLASSGQGFTLIETLIVVAIIGIAALIALPNYLVWQSRSELRQAVTEVQNQLLMARMAALSRNAPVTVAISITTLDADLKRLLEPRAASGGARLAAMAALTAAGVPVTLLFAPVIPALN